MNTLPFENEIQKAVDDKVIPGVTLAAAYKTQEGLLTLYVYSRVLANTSFRNS